MKVSFEKQTRGPLSDPAYGIILRLRPFQFGLLVGYRAVMVQHDA